MKKANFQLDTLTCPSCVLKIEAATKAVDGVDADSVKVLFNASKVKLDFDESKTSLESITHAITKVGYDVLKSSAK